ncbi:MAG TPA: GspMb/PilO family protein [Pyrinomonadaceae bacterium]|jgi:Tfp pilus assembly protein PilO|nr:GspMb/PilO family protein [Pyrinomonadaceae bacterium]
MSDPNLTGKATDTKTQGKPSGRARREQIRVHIDKLRLSRQRSMFGLAEVAGFAASLLLLIIAVFAYLYFLVPAYSRLSGLQRERTLLQEQLRGAQEGMTRSTDAQATVEEINLSVERFENQRLPSQNEGRMSLYTALNQMIRSNALRNTSGPTYVALDPLGSAQQGRAAATAASNRPGVSKWQSLFPGIGVSVTVEGQYANLRRFVRDLEASNQFIVINGVELEKASNTDEAAAAAAIVAPNPENPDAPPRAKAARGTLVSLRVDLAAYFRRGSSVETAPSETR